MIPKKGYVYLMTVSLLLVVLLGVFISSNVFSRQDQQEIYETRIRTSNDFVKNLNKDISRASYIAAFRTLIALEEYVSQNGVFLDDMNDSFRETFFYGTVNGTFTNLLINSSFSNYNDRVKTIASTTGMNIDMNVTNISLAQNTPWTVVVGISIAINISDVNNLASWEYTKEFTAEVPIVDLRDPLYGVFTKNKVVNTIRQFNESILVDSDNVTTNLVDLINHSYYISSTQSPNFIMRFENRIGADLNGIESIVNIQTLSDQDVEVYQDRDKVDFMYFNNLPGDKICDVQNVSDSLNFVINDNRTELYQIENLSYSTSCP